LLDRPPFIDMAAMRLFSAGIESRNDGDGEE
jgi:hypothetical protein